LALMEPEGFSKRVRLSFANGTVGFCVLLIVFVVVRGDPANSLHQSALAWAFALFGGVLAGIGFGAVAQLLPGLKK
jgi:uncharacterized membrane protein YdcZ (DUF606 family)